MRTGILIMLIASSCGNSYQIPENPGIQDPDISISDPDSNYHKRIGDIPTPAGYSRVNETTGSFTHFLRNLPLRKEPEVRLFNGVLKPNQSAQFAVVDIPVKNKNIQCADVMMLFRSEYLFSVDKKDEIAFMDFSGKWYRLTDGRDHGSLEKYLETVYAWCGSASLEKQLARVKDLPAMKPGDVFVDGGFPGHAVMVADMAENTAGKKIFMLVQGYQPAQDIHVLVNPNNIALSPWYELNDDEEINTPEWKFLQKHLRQW